MNSNYKSKDEYKTDPYTRMAEQKQNKNSKFYNSFDRSK